MTKKDPSPEGEWSRQPCKHINRTQCAVAALFDNQPHKSTKKTEASPAGPPQGGFSEEVVLELGF